MLTLRDILKSNFAYTSSTYDFEKNNLEPIDNSSDDIKSLALEIEREFRNQTYMDKEDLKIQKEFWKIYYKYVDKKKIGIIQPKISPSFLKKNLDLLN